MGYDAWRGTNFVPGGILILGESHYVRIPEDDGPDFTNKVIPRRALGARSTRYFNTLARLFRGRAADASARTEFWNSVAFYNFVQSSVGTGPRMRPTDAQWQYARDQLPTTLAALQPSVVLAVGRALWANLPAPEAVERADGAEIKRYGPVAVFGIAHPSGRGFSYATAQPIVDALRASTSAPCRAAPAYWPPGPTRTPE